MGEATVASCVVYDKEAMQPGNTAASISKPPSG
jgi:hypothetical protein